MSFSKPVIKKSARAAGKKTSNMTSLSPQAKHSVKSSPRHHHHHKSHDSSSPRTKQPQPDSGFFDGSDGEHYGDALPSHFSSYGNNADYVLFPEDPSITQNEGYYFDELEAEDIASTKANHGSLYRGQNNESNTLAANNGSDHPVLETTIYDNGHDSSNPPHHFTSHPATQAGLTQLKSWTHTFEQHESIAYRFEQPPNPSQVFYDVQQPWNEDIDLDLYAVLF